MKQIAIDGPAGSGKSTIAKLLADKINYFYLDSGALYRIIGFYINENYNINSKKDIIDALKKISIKIKNDNYYLNDNLIKNQIRQSNSGNLASIVAQNIEVRKKVNDIIQESANNNNIIVDGRDIGTVVLPNATFKFFVTASVEERAKRRFNELNSKKEKISYEKVKSEIEHRDRIDSNREIAPLKPAEDANIIDTNNKTIDQVLNIIINIIRRDNNDY